jgi:hypothetical protein
MRYLLALLAFMPLAAWAQDYPNDLDNTMVDNQVSADAVASMVFVAPNANRKGLRTLDVKNGAAAGFAMLVDGTAFNAGAISPCASAATARPCLMWCQAMAANTSLFRVWDSPLKFSSGIVAGYSTTGCATITTSATAMFMGQVP